MFTYVHYECSIKCFYKFFEEDVFNRYKRAWKNVKRRAFLEKTYFISAIDSTLIYEGLFSPENNLIVIIQNFYVWAVSSLGLLALIPFYQVRDIYYPVLLKCPCNVHISGPGCHYNDHSEPTEPRSESR